MSRLQILVLGLPEVYRDDRAIKLPTRKALALLTYLAVEGSPQSREHLSALLWPDHDPPRARATLRNTLSYLREAIGVEVLVADRDTVRLQLRSEDNFDLDVLRRAERGAADLPPDQLSAVLEAAAAQYRGGFLEGFSLDAAPAFTEWAESWRENVRRRVSDVFDRLCGLYLAAGEVDRILKVAAHWVTRDPVNEVAYQRVMQAHLAAGDRAGAMQAYAACRRTLEAYLDVEPAPETEALAARARLMATETERRDRSPRSPGGSTSLVPQTDSLEAPLVGRSDQFGMLVEDFHRARRGHTSVVILEGEAGIGKTRLASEFLRWADAQGADVIMGRGFETGGHLPYQSLVDALGKRLDRENAPDDLLGNVWLVELSRLLPDLRERYPDLTLSPADDGTGQSRLFEAVVQLSEALAQRAPVVLFVDDLQWADRASLDLLRYVARRGMDRHVSLTLLFALRSESIATSPDLADWVTALSRDLSVRRVDLRPLSSGDLRQLITGIGIRGDVAAFADWLYAETRGQPFYALETIRALVERGVLVAFEKRDGRRGYSVAASADNSGGLTSLLPPGVRQMITGRLARLSRPATDLLVASAVLGQRSAFTPLRQVAGLTEDEALLALDEAIGRQLLCETRVRASPASPAVYLPAHDKIRDVVYTDAGDARRRVFHRRAVDALRAVGAPAAELAHHALTAGLVAEACQFSVTAGEDSMQVYAVRDAIDHFQRAREVIADYPEAFRGSSGAAIRATELIGRLYVHLGRAYELQSQRDPARVAYEALLSHARASQQPTLEVTALNRLATLAAQNGIDFDRATALLQEARGVAEAAGDQLGLVETEWTLAQMGVYTSNPPMALRHGTRALELARAQGASELIARSLNALAYAYRNLGRWEDSATAAEEAATRYAELGNPELEVDSLGLLASSRVKYGALWDGIRAGRRALARSVEIDNPWGQVASAYHLVPGLLDAGLYGEARDVAQRGTATARTKATRPMLIFSLVELGAVQRALLALEDAREIHRETRILSQGLPALFQEMSAAALCADEALAGCWEQAYEAARRALEARGSSLHQTGLTRWLECEALVRAGDWELAEQDTRQFGEHLGGNRRFRIPYLRCLAVLSRAQGQPAVAISHLVDAASLARDISLPGEAWSIEVALADAYDTLGVKARATEARSRASAIVTSLADRLDPATRASFLKAAIVN